MNTRRWSHSQVPRRSMSARLKPELQTHPVHGPNSRPFLEVGPLHEPGRCPGPHRRFAAPLGVPASAGKRVNAEGVRRENPALKKFPAPPAIDARPAEAGTPNPCGSWPQLTSNVEVGPLHEPGRCPGPHRRFAAPFGVPFGVPFPMRINLNKRLDRPNLKNHCWTLQGKHMNFRLGERADFSISAPGHIGTANFRAYQSRLFAE
jgi:hypothetical protein